ncbi:hypothetical protein [Streptomyces sp. NPDC085937]|uniref:hypothetical protein n=1 Tax=Streptomyces sp. NPDC085937 TaxID=3365742 RepID=UPI0037CF9D29
MTYLDFQRAHQITVASSCTVVSEGHPGDADVQWTTARFARQCREQADVLASSSAFLGSPSQAAPERMHVAGLTSARSGPAGLLRDLQELYQLVSLSDITWSLVGQAARAVRNRELIRVIDDCSAQTTAQLDWLRLSMKTIAPQTLLVAT